MRRVTCMIAAVFILVMMAGNAFAWSERAEGRAPQQTPLGMKQTGVFVWHDRGQELHIRAVNSGRQHVYSGIIQTDGRFFAVKEKQLENGDYVSIDRDSKTIRFRFSTAGGVDGIDFKVLGGETVDFDLYKDGKEMPRKEIFLGKRGWHPWHNNFYLEK